MKKSISKKILIISIVMLLTFIIIGFTSIAKAMSVQSILDEIASDVNKFLSRPYTDYQGKLLDFSYEHIEKRNLTCIAHWYGTSASSKKMINQVIDINLDESNDVKINGKKYTGNQEYLFQALAKATSESNVDNTTRNKYEVAIYRLLYGLRNQINTGGPRIDGNNYGFNNAAGSLEYYNECIKHGNTVVNNSIKGNVSNEGYDSSLIDSEVNGNKSYLGPFQYTYDGNGNIRFSSIEIKGDEGFNTTIDNPRSSDLFVKTKEGFVGVENGKIKPKTDFYIATDAKVDDSSKINVSINIAGVSCYKSRVLIIKDVTGYGGQSLAAYSTGGGQQTNTDKVLKYEFENHKGNLEINKSGIVGGKPVSKVENMGYKVYYQDKNKKYYLKIITDTKTQDGRLIGDIKIKKQEITENSNDATVVYTDKNGQAKLRGIDSRYQYYLEEVADKTDFSVDVLKATQKLADSTSKETEVPIVGRGIVGPITVKKKRESEQTTVKIEDAKKTGNLHIVKEDYDKTGKKVSAVKFKVQNSDTKQWVKAEGSNGVYNLKTYDKEYSKNKEYYKDNYTSNENEATEFETNSNGEITINGVDIGKYVLKETYINNNNGAINYGYTEVDKPSNVDKNYVFWSTDGGKTRNSLAKKDIQLTVEPSDKTPKSTIYVYNKKKYLKITGFVWEDMLGGKDNNYEAYGKDTYAQGDTLVDGITVRLKDKNGNIVKTETTKNGGEYTFLEVSREALERGDYFVEFEYNGLTYTSVLTLVGDDSSVNSKAGEVVDQRKKLNAAFTEITNKDDINDRSHGYSRDGSGSVTGTLTYKNDTENWQSTFESTTYNNETYSGINLTANTDVSGYSLEKEFKEGRYTVDENDAFVIEHVNLGMRRREQPQMSISNDIENVEVDVNGYHHTYYYAQRNGQVQDTSAFNVGVKFGKEYVSGYTRAIYPSDVEYSATEAKDDDARKLKVYVTYATTIRNMSNNLQMSVNELANYYDKEYTIVDSWIGDNESAKVTWKNTSKYGQTYNDGNYIGAYTTSLAGTKINAGENLKVYIRFQVSDSAVLGLLNGTATLHNASEIFSYSTYYGSNIEGCNTGDIYAGIDRASAPGNAKPGDKTTYEADTDDAPSMLLEAKGVRELAGTVFEDATSAELKSGEERKGTGIYEDNENIISGVTVELLSTSDLSKPATIYPPEDNDKPEDVKDVKTAQAGKPATMITGADGKYIFRGIEPDTYLIRYTYQNGTTKVFDTTGKEVKDITVQDYKSTIITSSAIKQAFEDNDKHLDWYKTTEKEGRYSDARDDYKTRENIDNELMTLEGTSKPTITSLTADTPKFDIGVEKESIYTASAGDRYTALTENIDFGLVERPRQSATLGKEVAYLKVTLPNGQVLIDCDPRTGTHDYVTVTKDANGKVQEIYITIDSELIYGSQVEIKYDFTLANTSELDYRNESYYYYGDSKENPVKFTSATLIDYVDSDITLKAGQEGTWNVVNDLVNKGYNWNLTPEQEQQIIKNYSTLVKAEPISSDTPIAAGETKTTAIYVEKLLANSDELTYENNGEVVKIGKTGGRTMTTTLGSYAPVLAADINAEPGVGETDEAKAEAVTIIPPTGSTDNTVMYAIIGVTSLVVLAAGIFGTRKFLKK